MCKVITFKIGDRTVKAADIKKEYILNIANQAKDCAAIDRVVLFGSATGTNCTSESDIDIAVFGKKTESQMLKSQDYKNFIRAIFKYDFSQDYDVLYFESKKQNRSSIFDDINKGEILYEKA